MRLFEKYRPSSLGDVVGNDKSVAVARRIIDVGAGGKAIWISGASGTGKTTLARIIAGSIADDWMTTEIDAGELTPARLAEIERTWALFGMGKGGRALIVNEAHGLRRDTIRRFLVGLEALPGHVCVVFTTTRDGQDQLFEDAIDAGPLLSRCLIVTLTNQGLAKPFAARALEIARGEGLDGQPIEAYVKLAQRCKNNMRAMLGEIEAGCMTA
jgi:replication-associated recombination protein RarA